MIIDSSLLSDASKGFQSYFDRLKSETDNLIKQIYFFVNDSYLKDKLKGEGWNTVRKYMHSYISILEKLKVVCDTLSNNIVSANNSVIVAMGGYSTIDLNEIYVLKDKKNDLQNEIDRISGFWYRLFKSKEKNEQIDSTIQSYYSIIGEINNKLCIFENTKEAYENAKSIVSNDLDIMVTQFSSEISKNGR